MTTTDTHTLLLIHADREARHRLAAQLDLDGFTVHEADDASAARARLSRSQFALILLGRLALPTAAIELVRDLRAGRLERTDPAVPVITLGSVDTPAVVRAYEAGADHHLPSGVDYLVLRAVVAAVIRRTQDPVRGPQLIEIGRLAVDLAAREVRVDGQLVEGITAREFELLSTLASDPRRVFTKAELLQGVWGHEIVTSTRTLDSHASRLRRRIARAGEPGLVCNVWGVGYRLQ